MDAEMPVLSGWINVPTQSGFRISKKKPQRYCLLFKASRHGIERLEICETKDDKNPKIITLENCVKITHEPPPANLIQIVKKTGTLTLHTLTDDDLKEWVNGLQSVAFREKSMLHVSQVVIEEDNDLYCSSFGDGLFIITLIPSETSKRCNIEPKAYMLQLTTTELQLKSTEDPNVVVSKWPYRFIRKYGYRDGKFTFEAGRKCSTGEGVFTLDHTNPQEVFRCMSAKMKSMKKLIHGESIGSIECATENLLSVAAAMEAGSRSPLPPSPSTQRTAEFELNSTQSSVSLRGFISSSDSLNNISLNSSGGGSNAGAMPVPVPRPLPVKHVPSKPPRKLPSNAIEANAINSSSVTDASAISNATIDTPPTSSSSVINASGSSVPLNCDKLRKFSNPVSITTSVSTTNSNKAHSTTTAVILKPPPMTSNEQQQLPLLPPTLPVRNESYKSLLERDYESIETITDAWKTMGVSEVKHTERILGAPPPPPTTLPPSHATSINNNDELIDFVRQRSLTQRERKESQQLPPTPITTSVKKIIDIDIGESPSIIGIAGGGGGGGSSGDDDSTYDRLDFLIANNNNSSGYKTIVNVQSAATAAAAAAAHRLRCSNSSPSPPNEYELIASPDIQMCRKADDSHMGYGRIYRKAATTTAVTSSPSTAIITNAASNNNSSSITTTSISAYAEQQQQQSCESHNPLDHRSYNGLNYTIVSKPKRV